MLFQLDVFCRVLLGIVLLAAAVGKLRGRHTIVGTRVTLAEMAGGLPLPRTAVAVALPLAELLAALLLAVPRGVLAGYATAAVLLASFTLGIAATLRRGRRVPCRCFGASDTPVSHRHLVRNLLLLSAVVAGAGAHLAGGQPAPAVAVLAAGAAVLVAAAMIRLDDLMYLFAAPVQPARPPARVGNPTPR